MRHSIVESLPDGILVLDPQGIIVDINCAALAFLGIPGKNVIGFAIESAGASENQLLRAIISDESADGVAITQNHQIKILQVTKLPLAEPPGCRLFLIMDISGYSERQKVAEERAEKYRRKFSNIRLIADNMPVMLWAKDLEGKYIFANKSMCEQLLLAKNTDEPIGKSDTFFMEREHLKHPDQLDLFTIMESSSDSDQQVIRSGKPVHFEESGNVNGKCHYLDVHKSPIFDDQGNLAGVAGSACDITGTIELDNERIEVLESLAQSKHELLRLSAEKDKLYSIIAHDLRTPVFAFMGLTQILAEDLSGLTVEEVREMAVLMRNSAKNLFGLLENLLEWSRMKRGLIPFNPAILTLSDVVSSSLATISDYIVGKSIGITCEIPEDMVVFADYNMVQSIVRNLVSNAAKFTPRGGNITVTATAGNHIVEISVKDTGIGMSSKIVKGLFTPDLGNSRKGIEGESGTGFGLIICKDFIEKHGTEIWAESEVGKGSIFHFTLSSVMGDDQMITTSGEDIYKKISC